MCMLSLFCQLPNCNLFTQHVIYLYRETPLVNYGPRSILYIYITVYFYMHYLLSRNNYLIPRDTFNPFFTANRWDWQPHCKLGQSTLAVLCAGAIYKLSGAVAKLASINLRKLVLSPTGSINLDFILREVLLMCSSYLYLGVPNWVPTTHY
jgi:hypothetical protein